MFTGLESQNRTQDLQGDPAGELAPRQAEQEEDGFSHGNGVWKGFGWIRVGSQHWHQKQASSLIKFPENKNKEDQVFLFLNYLNINAYKAERHC